MKLSSEALARIPELDGLRGLAVILILFLHWHFIVMGSSLGLFGRILDLGWVGVELFFVLSGYLITSILLTTKDSPNYFKSFYGRRALRIFPLYFAALILYFHVQLPLMHRAGEWSNLTNQEEIWHWLDIQNWAPIALGHGLGPISHFWSLAVEEQFYFLWPFVVWRSSRKSLPIICGILILACFATGLAFEYLKLPQVWHDRATAPRAASIIAGSMIACLLQLPRANEYVRLARYTFLTCGIAINLLNLLRVSYFPALFTIADVLVTATWTSLVYWCVACTGSATMECRFARNGVLRNFGKYSYAIYVLHYTFIWPYIPGLVAKSPLWSSLPLSPAWKADLVYAAMFVALVFFSYGGAVLSWYALERPFLSLRRLFPYEMDRQSRASKAMVIMPLAED